MSDHAGRFVRVYSYSVQTRYGTLYKRYLCYSMAARAFMAEPRRRTPLWQGSLPLLTSRAGSGMLTTPESIVLS